MLYKYIHFYLVVWQSKSLGAPGIDEKCLKWYGHVKRKKSKEGLPKNIMEWELPGKGKRGRLEERWKEWLEQTMNRNNIKEDEVFDRKLWREKRKFLVKNISTEENSVKRFRKLLKI